MAQRGNYAKTQTIREQILSAALRVIADRGFSRATVQEVADVVGMSKTGVLHHFGSREALFAAVLERRDAVDAERAGGGLSDADGVETLFTIIERNADVPGLAALYSALVGDAAAASGPSPAREFAAERYPRLIAALAASIELSPKWSSADARFAATVLIAAADGLQTQWLLDPTVDMAGTLRELWRRLDSER